MKLEEQEIKKHIVNETSYKRGQKLYEDKKVLSCQVIDTSSKNFVGLFGLIEGEHNTTAEVFVNEERGEIIDFQCECMEYEQSGKLCKHCVAICLAYINGDSGTIEKEPTSFNRDITNGITVDMAKGYQQVDYHERGEAIDQDEKVLLSSGIIETEVINNRIEEVTNADSISLTTGKHNNHRNERYLETNRTLASWLTQQAVEEVERISFYNSKQYHLQPRFDGKPGAMELKILIGQDKMYLVKDLNKLVIDFEEENYAIYGLQFTCEHKEADLDARSREFLIVIKELIEKYNEEEGLVSDWSYSGYQTIRRVLPSMEITDEILVCILRLYCDTSIKCKFDNNLVYYQVSEDREYWPTFVLNLVEGGARFTANFDSEDRMRRSNGISRTSIERTDKVVFDNEKAVIICPKNQRIYIKDIALWRDLIPFMRIFYSEWEDLRIGYQDLSNFALLIYPRLMKVSEIIDEDGVMKELSIVDYKVQMYLDKEGHDEVNGKVYLTNGDKAYNIMEFKKIPDVNLILVEELQQLFKDYFTDIDEIKMSFYEKISDAVVFKLLSAGVQEMIKYGEVYLSESLRNIHIRGGAAAHIGVSLAGNLVNMEIKTGLSNDELEEILKNYVPKKKYYRLKNGDFVEIEDESLGEFEDLREITGLSTKEVMRQLRLSDNEEICNGIISVPQYQAFRIEQKLRGVHDVSAVRDQLFTDFVEKIDHPVNVAIPEDLQAEMRNYQVEGFRWLKKLKELGFGGILADDMGLGKTLQVISFLLSEYNKAKETNGRCKNFVVCPASLVYNWNAEIERFAPSLPVRMVVGTASERAELISAICEQEIVITSYELLRRDLKEYKTIEFDNMVIDEAQFVKNPAAKVSKSVKAIRANSKFALTGTPIENRLSELWSIFDYLMPGFLFSYEQFKRNYEVPIVTHNDEKAMSELRTIIAQFILRRLKRDVLQDLPEKFEKNMYARLEGEQEKLYKAHVAKLKNKLGEQTEDEVRSTKFQILAELTRIRQICCDPSLIYDNYSGESAKLKLCMEIVRDAIEGGHKILLFSQFTTMLDLITAEFDTEEISYYSLTGKTPKSKRQELMETFNKDDTSVFVISLKAGGTGLNLTAADIVIHFDPWWNISVQNQATDRAHRIGQERKVVVYKLLMQHTIEEQILKLQESKQELADQVLSGEHIAQSSLDKNEILKLLD